MSRVSCTSDIVPVGQKQFCDAAAATCPYGPAFPLLAISNVLGSLLHDMYSVRINDWAMEPPRCIHDASGSSGTKTCGNFYEPLASTADLRLER